MSTKLGVFQNLWDLSQYTKPYLLFQREYYMLYITFYSIDVFNACKWTVSRKKWPKMVDFYVHLNRTDGHYVRSINFKT